MDIAFGLLAIIAWFAATIAVPAFIVSYAVDGTSDLATLYGVALIIPSVLALAAITA